MEKYFLIRNRRIVKAIFNDSRIMLADLAYEYINGEWEKISPNIVNDRLIGYDSTETTGSKIGDSEVIEEIREILADKIDEYLK
jgi:hypothetical protein